jgi:DNA modification methylase
MKFPSQHIEFWPLERLIPYEKNPRTHSDAQVAQLAESMKRFGFTCPLIVDGASGILAGHGRLRAARLLKLPEVPVIVVDYLTEAEKLAYMVADNQLALNADWDEAKLQGILAELDRDLREAAGFDEQEFRELTAKLAEDLGKTDEDAVPEPSRLAVSVPGDVWELGPHRVLCGDATLFVTIEQVMAGERAEMCFTDPTYNVNYEQVTASAGPRRLTNDDLGDRFEPFLYEACLNILRVTSGAVYMCMASSELHTLYSAFTRAGGHWSTFLIWAKDRFTLGRSDYQRQFEPILYGWRQGNPHFWAGARDQGDVWQVQKPRVNDLHPTMKPIELIERAIVNSSRHGDIVLDPFAGSGSTLIACQKTGRRARVIELEPTYVDVIVKRWEEYTGKWALLRDRTFTQVVDERLRKVA